MSEIDVKFWDRAIVFIVREEDRKTSNKKAFHARPWTEVWQSVRPKIRGDTIQRHWHVDFRMRKQTLIEVRTGVPVACKLFARIEKGKSRTIFC